MRSAVIILAATVALSGCASIDGYPAMAVKTVSSACPVQTPALPVNTAAAYYAASDPATRRNERDRIIDACVKAIDTSYGAFAQALSSEQKSFAIGTDVATAGLTGAAALAKSAATKTRLSTYAAGVLGLRGTVDRELLFSKTLTALVAQMDASRLTIRARILEGQSRPDADYPLRAGDSDLGDYFNAGTLNRAISSITSDAGAKEAVATEKIIKINRYASTADDLTDKLNDYLAPDGQTVDAARLDKVVACTGAASRREAVRIVNAGTREDKAAAVGCLKGKGEPIP